MTKQQQIKESWLAVTEKQAWERGYEFQELKLNLFIQTYLKNLEGTVKEAFFQGVMAAEDDLD